MSYQPLECEWCGHQHASAEICTQRPKARGIGRRSFLGLFGVGVAGLLLAPAFSAPPIDQPLLTIYTGPNPNIGQMVAAEWERIIRSQPFDNIFDQYAGLRGSRL